MKHKIFIVYHAVQVLASFYRFLYQRPPMILQIKIDYKKLNSATLFLIGKEGLTSYRKYH